jgi:hypothetical protein
VREKCHLFYLLSTISDEIYNNLSSQKDILKLYPKIVLLPFLSTVDRVKAKYGRPCGLALGQLQVIEAMATQYQTVTQPIVKLTQFIE